LAPRPRGRLIHALRTSSFEQAIGQAAARSDTLEIVRYDADGVDTSRLVPYKYADPLGSGALLSTVIDIGRLGFRDTTFVRGSGDFNRAIFGEGGSVNGSRAMTYNAIAGI